VEAAGVEPEISVENTQLTDSENASITKNATTSKSSVQIAYKDLPELQNFQASPALAQHAKVFFNIYTLKRMLFAAVLHDRKVSQAAVVGSSHGGNIAMSFAQRYPAQVSELVLIGPEAEGFPYSERFAMAQKAFQGAKDPTEVRVQNTYFIVPRDDAAREHVLRLLKLPLKTMSTTIRRCRKSQPSPYVQDLRVPPLILVGSGGHLRQSGRSWCPAHGDTRGYTRSDF